MILISPHFTEAELTITSAKGPDGKVLLNPLTGTGRMYLRQLCNTILEPVRDLWGCSVLVTSGWRSPAVNEAVSGATNSAHTWGRAADIVPGSLGISIDEAYRRIWASGLPYDELFLEKNLQGRRWIHVSCAPKTRVARRKAETFDGVRWAIYSPPIDRGTA